MKVTFVIPTYNEATNLSDLVAEVFSLHLPEIGLILVDDNSPDGTGEIAETLSKSHPGRIRVIHRAGKLGLGSAYLEGFELALTDGANAVGQMDADFSHDPEKIVDFIQAIDQYDLVIGSRYVSGGSLDEGWPLWRKGLSQMGNIYARSILGLPVRDATAGFRLWRRETLLGMPRKRVKSNGYAFQIEMAYIAYRLGYRLHEVPIYFAERHNGTSKMSLRIQFEAAIRVWLMLYEYRDLRKGEFVDTLS
ncbi:MAG: polyprenol monophosphomannose synthase [Anaerolineales bacterium]